MRFRVLKYSRRQRGVTLVEILIAILVFSVGLLGLASLQLFSLQANQGAYHRSQAVSLAYEVVDFLRVNRARPDQALDEDLLAFWRGRAAEHLPSGTLDDPVFSQGNSVVEVTVRWRDDRLGDELAGGEVVAIRSRL